MARKLRIQYENALYHVINRGNFRRDVFETAGAARAFEECLMPGSPKNFIWVVRTHSVFEFTVSEKLRCNMFRPDPISPPISSPPRKRRPTAIHQTVLLLHPPVGRTGVAHATDDESMTGKPVLPF